MTGCVDSSLFYTKLEELKQSKKRKSSSTTIFIDNDFFDESKRWLQTAPEEKQHLNLDKLTKQKIVRNHWRLTTEGKVTTSDNKLIVPKRDIYHVLCEAHSASAHRGRDKTERYIRQSYAGISQEIINLFVSLCKLHQQQKSVTNHWKKPITNPIRANQFLAHVQMDLIDFRNLPCECQSRHNWALHIVDHFSKYSWMFALKRKQTEEVAVTLANLFWLFGFPSILHSDNGKEFKSKTMSELCRKHKIKQVHGAPRTPSTQGLVERSNRTVKENILNILKERDESLGKWCAVLGEAAYKKNITLHRAINKVPYEVVFGVLPRKEMPEGTVDHTDESKQFTTQEKENTPTLALEFDEPSSQDDFPPPSQNTDVAQPLLTDLQVGPPVENPNKRKRAATNACVSEKQECYNKKMKESRNKVDRFKIDDFVCIKIDKVDKSSPLHPNVLLGKVTEVQNNYAKIVTKFGIISTYISTSRLNKCTQTSVHFDYTKQITFSSACKMAVNQ